MNALLICYTLEDSTVAMKAVMRREFLGYEDRSNHGKYLYKRKGILGTIPHMKPAKGVLIVRKEDENLVKKYLRKYKANVKSFEISINSSLLS